MSRPSVPYTVSPLRRQPSRNLVAEGGQGAVRQIFVGFAAATKGFLVGCDLLGMTEKSSWNDELWTEDDGIRGGNTRLDVLGLEAALVALAGGGHHPEEYQLHQPGVALHPVTIRMVDD